MCRENDVSIERAFFERRVNLSRNYVTRLFNGSIAYPKLTPASSRYNAFPIYQRQPPIFPIKRQRICVSFCYTQKQFHYVCLCIRILALPIGAFQDQCKQTMINKYSTDDYRTLLSSCIRLSINYCHRDFVIFSN